MAITLEQGPFSQQPDTAVTVQPGVYDFTSDALTLFSALTGTASSWDAFIADLGLMAADPLEDLTGSSLDSIVATLGVGVALAGVPSIDALPALYSLADSQLTIAFNFAPSQAWADPPAPYTPPDNVLNLTAPTIPINAFTPGASLPVSGPNAGPPPPIQLLNLTRLGQANFVVGDQWEIIGTGKPGQIVSVGGTFNGAQLAISVQGTLDDSGGWGEKGTMPPESVGAWHEDWYLDGILTVQFNFVVSNANTQ